jgi:hypothetical protein
VIEDHRALVGSPNDLICTPQLTSVVAAAAVQNGGYVRIQEDTSHLAIGTVMGASGCMNIRACLVPAMPAHAA